MSWSTIPQHCKGAVIITPEVLHSRCIDFAKLADACVFHKFVHLSGIVKEDRAPVVLDQWHLVAGSDKFKIALANNVQKTRLPCFLPGGIQPALTPYVRDHNDAISQTLQIAKQ